MKTFPGDTCFDKNSCNLERYCSILMTDYVSDNQYALFIEILKFIASLSAFSVAYLIMRDERISAHPGKLLALIALCQGGAIMSGHDDILSCSTNYYTWIGMYLKPIKPYTPLV